MGPDPKDPDYIQAKIADSKITLLGTDTIQLCDDIDILEGIQKANGRIPDVTDAIAMLRARLKELKATSCGVREFSGGERHSAVIQIVDHHMQTTYNGDLSKYVAGMDRTIDKLTAMKDENGIFTPQAVSGMVGASLIVDELGFRGANIKDLKAKIASTRSMMPIAAPGAGRLSAATFCRCIKKVRKTVKPRKGSTREQAAIGICVKSVLHSRGKTIKKFSCGKKARLVTQKRKGGCACNWK